MTITVQELLDKASEQAGLSDFGDAWFRGPLQAYVEDLQGPQLSDWGRAFLVRLVVKDLARRLDIIDCLKRNPEIEHTPIPPIVYITGHERSGTTLLHNLLALHQDARSLSRWELMAPTPPPEQATFATDPRRAEIQASVDALRGSGLENMHWVNADEPEECVWGFMDCTGLLGMAVGLIMPNWQEWIMTNDMTPCLENYRRIIQVLTWKNPVPEGGFLALKSPQMTSYLPAFLSVFPDTHFVFLHRDPYRVLRSFTTLIDVVDGPFLQDRTYLEDLERNQKRSLVRMGHYFEKLSEFDNAHPDRVINIQYADMLDAPQEAATAICERARCPGDAQLNQKIEDFLALQKAGERAKPRQEMIDYGYSRGQVESYPPVAAYLARYGVIGEEKRRTGL